MTCPQIEDLFWDDFLGSGLQDRLREDRVPFVGTLEVTERCNLRCTHCYLTHRSVEAELSLNEIRRTLDEVAELGCLGLLLTGGEPFVRRDFLDIYAHAKRRGFWITLFTNGTLLTPWVADYLEEWRPRLLEISVYGASARVYESITGVPGSFEKCMAGIDLILERDIPLTLKTMVLRQNVHELDALRELADGLGVPFRFDQMICPRNDGSDIPYDARLSPEEAVRIDWEDEERRAEFTELFDKLGGHRRTDRRLFRCGAGIEMFHIDSYGIVRPCRLLRSLGFSLRDMPFKRGWEDVLPSQLVGELPPDHRCVDCDWSSVCLQCPGWSDVVHGDLTTPVDYLCKVTELRAQAFRNDREGSNLAGLA